MVMSCHESVSSEDLQYLTSLIQKSLYGLLHVNLELGTTPPPPPPPSFLCTDHTEGNDGNNIPSVHWASLSIDDNTSKPLDS